MTVFISEEGHIFQAVESSLLDRHIMYDGRLERPGGATDSVLSEGKLGNSARGQQVDLTRHCGVSYAVVKPKKITS